VDMWKYFDITHRNHTVMNPLSLLKTDELVELLDLPDGGAVVDIACGKAAFLCRVADRYGVTGTGVDASPFTAAEAKQQVESRGLAERIAILHQDGATYAPAEPATHCMASCIGGSWVFQGHKGTLEALGAMTRPGGLVLVGEPFWKRDPDPAYLAMTGYTLDQHGTHPGNVQAGVDLGLAFLYAAVSNEDDWDRYEGLQYQAAERHAATHPDDPDVDELLTKVRTSRDAYLRWGRDCLGWAMYLFRKP